MKPPSPPDSAAAWTLFTADVELTNRCSEHCAFCPREAITRPRGEMAVDVARAMAEALAEVTAQVTFSGMGDPSSHPHLSECVALFHARGLPAGIQMGAGSLDAPRIMRLAEASPSFINLSLPSADPDVLARLMPGKPPAELLANVDHLADNCRGRIGLTLIGTRTVLDPDGDALARFAVGRDLAVRHAACHSRGGNFGDPEILAADPEPGLRATCGLFARHGFFTWEGDLLACCHDLTGETRIGNGVSDPLPDLLAHKSRLASVVPPFNLCGRCDEPLRTLPPPAGHPPATKKARGRYFRSLGAGTTR